MADGGVSNLPDCVLYLRNIDLEDLQYVERDLCFYELVSLGYLLFGTTRSLSEFILQKLLVLANTAGRNSRATNLNGDLLRKYATTNPNNWRATLVEALAIIDARHVLRKLGFRWESVRQHYLPHIAELSLHVHPLLKALYKMCERLTAVAAGRLVLDINEQHQRHDTHLRFYDSTYLEVYLLHWMTLGIIEVGDANANGSNVQVLIDYFKLNEMYEMKALLVSTITNNAVQIECTPTGPPIECNSIGKNDSDNGEQRSSGNSKDDNNRDCISPSTSPAHVVVNGNTHTAALEVAVAAHECYLVRREHAGLVLIINQKEFHQESSPELQHLLPREQLSTRLGTDVDKKRIEEVFTSFGYRPAYFENLNHTDLLYRIDETVKRSFLYDSLIVCILSHGIDGCVYGSNSIPVEIFEIEHRIAADALRGKPKMLIIQACQIDNEAANNTPKKRKNRLDQQTIAKSQSLTNRTDMIKAMSTVPGFAAMRHTIEGTWFIEALCKAVHNLGDRKHMLDILTAVQRDVANRRGKNNELMVPLSSYTLTKDFYLPRRIAIDILHNNINT